jgi:glycosyltransferase involved in cell wall biosynthesis
LRRIVGRARTAGDSRLYALLAFRDEMRYLPGWFAANAHQVDGVIAYDDGSADGSAEYVAAQPGVLELLHRPSDAPTGWDEPGVHRALVAAAGRHGADWLVAVDADERMEEQFGARVRVEIARLEGRGIRASAVRIRELWDGPDRVRMDGAWGDKWHARLFAWRADHESDPRRLHGHWAPMNAMTHGGFPPSDVILYHLRMMHDDDRERRRTRYEAGDPLLEFQPQGYSHLTDTTGLELAGLPEGRGYLPLHREPELAVVVLSLANQPELPGAVRSVLAQGAVVELVVVNSGGGDVASAVGPLGARVVSVPERLYAGGARNVGIAATRARYVSFLAADCRAEAGWVDQRLSLHRSGSRAVASSVTNANPGSAASWASYVLVFGRRLPQLDDRQALRYGVSYDRTLFEEYGTFREDLRVGEDTELHARWAGRVPIDWAPRVRTAHLHPPTLRALAADQFARGARSSAAWAQLDGPSPLASVRGVAKGAGRDLARAIRMAEPWQRRRLGRAALVAPFGLAAFAAGALRRRRS